MKQKKKHHQSKSREKETISTMGDVTPLWHYNGQREQVLDWYNREPLIRSQVHVSEEQAPVSLS
jgi:hypothetical protein